jgi:hypothetical protein
MEVCFEVEFPANGVPLKGGADVQGPLPWLTRKGLDTGRDLKVEPPLVHPLSDGWARAAVSRPARAGEIDQSLGKEPFRRCD